MFNYQTTIHLHQIDAAGVMFYGHLFSLIHDSYEAFLNSKDLSLQQIINQKDYVLPIVHAEADYKKGITLGEIININLQISQLTEHSFTIAYALTNNSKAEVATAKTVHVAIDKHTGKTISVPQELRLILQ